MTTAAAIAANAAVESDEEIFAATRKVFVRSAAGLFGELAANAETAVPRLVEIGATCDALRLGGPARLCRAAADAPELAADAVAVLADWFATVAAAPAPVVAMAAWRDDVGLLARLAGGRGARIGCEIGGEFGEDCDDLLSAMRDELAWLASAMAAGVLPPPGQLAEARRGARGIAGIAALLALSPLVDLARLTENALAAPALDWPTLDAISAAVDVMRELLDGLGGERMPLAARFAAVTAELEAAVGRAAEAAAATPVEPERPVGSEAGAAADEAVPSSAAGAACRFLTVVVDGQRYGVETERVLAVLAPEASELAGVPVVDLRARFGLPPRDVGQQPSVVLVEDLGRDRPRPVGVVVDLARDVVDVTARQFEAIADDDCVAGTARLTDGVLQLLDLDRLLADGPAR